MRSARVLWCVVMVAAFSTLVAAAADPIYRLSLGDAARRDRDVAVVLDGIVDTAGGDTIDPTTLAASVIRRPYT